MDPERNPVDLHRILHTKQQKLCCECGIFVQSSLMRGLRIVMPDWCDKVISNDLFKGLWDVQMHLDMHVHAVDFMTSCI